jgi:flagellar hook-associated protein 1 FlgK
MSAVATATALQDDGTQLALFQDGVGGATTYSGSLDSGGQKQGFASRITVNSLVAADNELLVRFASSPETPLGDTARPLALLDRLTNTTFNFSSDSGIGSSQRPFSGTVESFTQRIISFQSGRASQAERELSAQDVVVTALRERFVSDTAVDINKELTLLIELQNSFSANARIVQAVSELFDVLFASV